MRLEENRRGWILGLPLSLTASILWGLLPIALSIVRRGLDPYTITWCRFASAGVFVGLALRIVGRFPNIRSLSRRAWILAGFAVVGLAGNYVTYVAALPFVTPTVVQIVMQLGPMLLLLSGIVLDDEPFSRAQWAGLAVLVAGLLLFFNRQLPELFRIQSRFAFGIALLTVSTILWAGYGVAQKRLLAWMESQQILALLFCCSALVLFPWASFSAVPRISRGQAEALAFCCLNTIVAYGAFAESLKHWEASRVGAVLSTSPIVTVVAMWGIARWAPTMIAPERLNWLGITGTFLVVCGSAACALARQREEAVVAVEEESALSVGL